MSCTAAQAHELLGFPSYLNHINFTLTFQISLLRFIPNRTLTLAFLVILEFLVEFWWFKEEEITTEAWIYLKSSICNL